MLGHLGSLGRLGASGRGGAPVGPPTAFALTDIASGQLFQRAVGATSGPVRAAGTYGGGTPDTIELQVLKVSDNSIVKDWTAASATISGGNWSATVTGVDQGGPYYVKARPANAAGLAQSGSNPFFIGIMIVMYGQSNMLMMSSVSDGSPPAANAATTYYTGSAWGAVPAANGVRSLLNGVNAASGVPVGAMNGAISGVPIAWLMEGAGTGYFETLASWIDAVGDAEIIVWLQGEGDAAGSGSTIPSYVSNQGTLHSQLCSVTGRSKAQMPFVLAGLGNTESSGTDANWDAMQRALLDCASTNASTYYSHSNMDVVRQAGDVYHYDGASQGRNGARFAQSVATVLGYSTGFPRSSIVSAATVDATHTDVTISHSMGTDFTPISGATGFELSGDNGGTWAAPSAVDHTGATTMRLTHASLPTDSRRLLRYQYGKFPDVSNPVKNDGSLAAPLVESAGNIAPTPLAALPVATYRTNSALLTGSGANFSQSGLNIVNAASDLLLIATLTVGASQVLSAATITPNGGSPISAAIVKTDSTNSVHASIIQFLIPSGTDLTNCTFAATFAGSIFNAPRVGFWTVPQADLSSTTAVDKQTVSSASASTLSIPNLTTAVGGIIIAVSAQNTITANGNTWSGTEAFVERYDILANGKYHSGADASNTGASAGGSVVTSTWTGAASNMRVTAASWR
jgi:hypothetical protein